MAVAFFVLPARILFYSFVRSAAAVVWLQGLDGIGAGIYGIAVVAITVDLARGNGHFNTLNRTPYRPMAGTWFFRLAIPMAAASFG